MFETNSIKEEGSAIINYTVIVRIQTKKLELVNSHPATPLDVMLLERSNNNFNQS